MPGRSRGKTLKLRVTEEELAFIQEKMARAGVKNREAYLRKMAMDGAVVSVDMEPFRDLASLLRISSSNLNQIARRANETRSIYAADLEDLQDRYAILLHKTMEIAAALEIR